MKSNVSLALLLVAAIGASAAQRLEELPPATADQGDPPSSTAPQGSSQLRPGEARFDRVGRAGLTAGEGSFALSGELAPGSFAEITSLDSGKTILVQVRGEGSGLVALSNAAAGQLGVTNGAPVRVRRVTVTPQDSALLAAGRATAPRPDAPQALLVGLRRMLAGQMTPAPAPAAANPGRIPPPKPLRTTPAKPEPVRAAPAPKPAPVARNGLFVQVAALSNAQRARALAEQLGGIVRSAGSLHRVQLGPFANRAAAERARADIARRGYADARIISIP